MTKRLVISVSQLFCMLFISRLVVEITYSSTMVNGNNLWDHVLSCIVAFILIFLLVIPVCLLFAKDRSMDVIDNSCLFFGKAGYVISGFYALYFLLVCVHTLALFKIFLINVINPPIPVFLLLIIMALSVCFGAYKGVEGLARTSGIVLIFMLFSIVFIGISLYSQIEYTNFTPFLYSGSESFIGGILFMISRSSCIPAMALLLPFAKGNAKKGIVLWNTSTYIFIASFIALIVGTMGDFIKTQAFPVYTAASIAKIGSFEHLDALYLGVWVMGIFIKASLFLMLSGECIKKFAGETPGKISVIIFAILMTFSSWFITKDNAMSGIFSTQFLLWSTIIAGVVIPAILLMIKIFTQKGEKIQNAV